MVGARSNRAPLLISRVAIPPTRTPPRHRSHHPTNPHHLRHLPISLPTPHHPRAVASPPQLLNPPSKPPLRRITHQTFSHWILPHIPQLLRVILLTPQPMMKTRSLPNPSRISMLPRKLPLPKLHPPLHRKLQITRTTKQMHMIRHQNIITHQPAVRLTPNSH